MTAWSGPAWLLLWNALGALSSSDWADGVTLYIPFTDGDVQARFAAGSANVSSSIHPDAATSTAQNGSAVPAGLQLSVGCPCNLPIAEGTISVWLRWSEAGTDSGQLSIYRFSGVELSIAVQSNGTASVVLSTSGYDGSFPARWVADKLQAGSGVGSWHRVLISWNAKGHTRLDVDGQHVLGSSRLVPGFVQGSSWDPSLRFCLGSQFGCYGSSGVNPAPFELQELIVWNRQLDNSTIAATYSQRKSMADALNGTLPLPHKIIAETGAKVGFAFPKAPIETIKAPGEVFQAVAPVSNMYNYSLEVFVTANIAGWGRESMRLTILSNLSRDNSLIIPPLSAAFVSYDVHIPNSSKYGPYRLDLSLRFTDAGSNLHTRPARTVASFAVWPVPKPASNGCRSNWFGSHISAGACRYLKCPQQSFLQQAKRLGQCGPLRDHDFLDSTIFSVVEPLEGRWAFGGDVTINATNEHGLSVLGSLAKTPDWAVNTTDNKTSCAGPWDLCHPPQIPFFQEYAERVIQRYSSNVRSYELWNEPADETFWDGSSQQFKAVAAAARNAITKVALAPRRPVELLIGGFTPRRDPASIARQRSLLDSGALQFADSLSFHLPPFVCSSYSCDAPVETAAENFRLLNEIIGFFRAASNQTRKPQELWDTEAGVPDITFFTGLSGPGLPPAHCLPRPNYHEAAAKLVVGEAMLQVLGVSGHYYYAQYDPTSRDYETDMTRSYRTTNMLDFTLAPRPKLLARVAFASQIAGCMLPPKATRLDLVWQFHYTGCDRLATCENGQVTLLWSEGGNKQLNGTITTAATWFDTFGNLISSLDANSSIVVSTSPSFLRSRNCI